MAFWHGTSICRGPIDRRSWLKIGGLSLGALVSGMEPALAQVLAAEDAGGSVLGKPIEIVAANHQNKADIGVAIARHWFESDGVDMAIGFDHSAVALAVIFFFPEGLLGYALHRSERE